MKRCSGTLRSNLSYEPVELQFGTSGRRGEVAHLTQLEVYINALAELEYLQTLPREQGGIVPGDAFYFAHDLRPSSSRYVIEQDGRGELAQAVVQAIHDSKMRPVNLGKIPTPALTHYALSCACGSIMVTGSHIPFDRNGYKTNSARGELRKEDEGPINERVGNVRRRLYSGPYNESIFNERGLFKSGPRVLPPESDRGRKAYLERYAEFYSGCSLSGRRLLVYEHSAVGRDLLVELLDHIGAEVIPAGRSDRFVPIDTENIGREQLAAIQALARQVLEDEQPIFALVSTDGDSDRPLILGPDPATSELRFFPGDIVGMITAQHLGADAVVVPISCNDAIDRGRLKEIVEPKTKIGSPYVIAGMEKAQARGRRRVCGWEANGGFLTGSDIERNGRILKALPTRDAVLPILCTLFAAHDEGLPLAGLFSRLPKRFSRAALLKGIPRQVGLKIVRELSPAAGAVREIVFGAGQVLMLDEQGGVLPSSAAGIEETEFLRKRLERFFGPDRGFGSIARANYVDGVRAIFCNGDVAHVRPSGNADELRIYAVADTQSRADEIADLGIAEPDGILRSLERALPEF